MLIRHGQRLTGVCSGIVQGSKQQYEEFFRFAEANEIRPQVDRVFSGLDQVVEAHRYLESGRQVGKIVMTPGGTG